jgi:hypothetical protein
VGSATSAAASGVRGIEWPGREHERDRLRLQAAGDERERPRRRPIAPPQIVEHEH